MTKRIIGIDIIDDKLQLVQLDIAKNAKGYDNLFIFEYPIAAELPATLLSAEATTENTANSPLSFLLTELRNTNRLEADTIVSGLYKNSAQMKVIDVPFNRAQKIDAVLPGLMSDESVFASEDLALSWFLLPKATATKDNAIS